MAKSDKKRVRREFRRSVFERADYRCEYCGTIGSDRQRESGSQLPIRDCYQIPNLDAHHITPREDMPNGGYVAKNGISLCDDCHIKAEEALKDPESFPQYQPDHLYLLINSSHDQAVEASEKL